MARISKHRLKKFHRMCIRQLVISLSLGGIARKPRPISTERCSTDLTDLIDIFTVDGLYEVKKKSIISAQTDEAGLRYRTRKF